MQQNFHNDELNGREHGPDDWTNWQEDNIGYDFDDFRQNSEETNVRNNNGSWDHHFETTDVEKISGGWEKWPSFEKGDISNRAKQFCTTDKRGTDADYDQRFTEGEDIDDFFGEDAEVSENETSEKV